MIEQIGLALTDIRIGQRLVYFLRFGLYPTAVLPVLTLLSDLANVDFGIEVRDKSFVVIATVE